MTSKQRSKLKSIAANLSPVTQIGKGGLSENLIRTLSEALDARGVEYAETQDGPVDVFGDVELTDLSMALLAENCRLLSASERDESLESYYINLVGGGSRA